MKKIIYLLPILLIQCAPATILTGCSSIDNYEVPTTPTTIDGRGATTTTTSTTSTTGT